MAQLTVLDMTQTILSALNSDEVNSISDTTESMQIVNIIKNKYYDILDRGNLPEQQTLIQLTASGDNTKPTLMYVPTGVLRIDWIKYFDNNDNSTVVPGYKYVTMLPIDQFLNMIDSFNPEETNVGTFTFVEGGNNFTFYYKNDRQPCYCTIIENHYIVFDSFNSDLETTLESTNTQAYSLKVTPFTMSDNFIPDLDDDKFSLLLNEAKALAFYELKQMPHPMAQLEIKRQWSAISKDKSISNKPTHFDQLPNFGRTTRNSVPNRWMRQKGP